MVDGRRRRRRNRRPPCRAICGSCSPARTRERGRAARAERRTRAGGVRCGLGRERDSTDGKVNAMTIVKKLYLSFGSIVVILVLLFFTNAFVDEVTRRQPAGVDMRFESVVTLDRPVQDDAESPGTARLPAHRRRRVSTTRLDARGGDPGGALHRGAHEPHVTPCATPSFRMEANSTGLERKIRGPDRPAARERRRRRHHRGGAAAFYAKQDPAGWIAASMVGLRPANAAIRSSTTSRRRRRPPVSAIGTAISTVVTMRAILLVAAIAYHTARIDHGAHRRDRREC